MPLTEEQKHQIEEEERQRAEALKPTWQERLQRMFDWATQGSPKNPLGWTKYGLGNLNPMNPPMPDLQLIMKAQQGDPQAQAQLSENARQKLGILGQALSGAISGGPMGMALGAAAGTVLPPPKDAADIGGQMVGAAAMRGLGSLPIKLGGGTLPGATIPTQSNLFKNALKMLPMSMGGTAAQIGATEGMRPQPEGNSTGNLLQMGAAMIGPFAASGLQKLAGTSQYSNVRRFLDSLFGKKAMEPTRVGQMQAARQGREAAETVEEGLAPWMTLAKEPREAQKEALRKQLSNLNVKERELALQQIQEQEEATRQAGLMGAEAKETGTKITEAKGALLASRLGIKGLKEQEKQVLGEMMNDVNLKQEGLSVDKLYVRLLRTRLADAVRRKEYSVVDPLTGENLSLKGASQNVAAAEQRLISQLQGTALAQRGVTSARAGGAVESPASKIQGEIGEAAKAQEALLKRTEEAKVSLRNLTSDLQNLKAGASLKVKSAAVERAEVQLLAAKTQRELDAVVEFNKSNPIMPTEVREFFNKSFKGGSRVGSVQRSVMGDMVLDPNTDPSQLNKVSGWIKQHRPDLMPMTKDAILNRIAERFLDPKGGVEGGRSFTDLADRLKPFFGDDVAQSITGNLMAFEKATGPFDRLRQALVSSTVHSEMRKLIYTGNPMPVVTTAGVAAIIVPPRWFFTKVLENPVLGRQFEEWSVKGGFNKAYLKTLPILNKFMEKLPEISAEQMTKLMEATGSGGGG